MNANLQSITAASEPGRFVNAAVLSPDDKDLDCSEEAFTALTNERKRLNALWGTTRDARAKARLEKVSQAIATLVARQAKKGRKA